MAIHRLVSPRTHPKRQSRARPGPKAAEPVPCPACGHDAGFILDVDGFSYRVLEDDRDTELLTDQDAETPLSCAHCDTAITLHDALEITHRASTARTSPPRPETALHRTHKGHPHDVGQARTRHTRDGALLPGCPQCGRDHGFLADIDGVAYHVLEDDRDTHLLAEAENLLCPDCGAVFTIDGTHHT